MVITVGTFVSPISIEDDLIWKTYFCCKKSCKCCSKRSTTHVIMTLIEFPIQPWKKKNFFTSSTIVLLVDKFEALIATNRREWCLQVNHQVNSRGKKGQSRKKEFVSKIYSFLFFSSFFYFLFLCYEAEGEHHHGRTLWYNVCTGMSSKFANTSKGKENNCTCTRLCVSHCVRVRLCLSACLSAYAWMLVQKKVRAWVCFHGSSSSITIDHRL